MTYCIFCHKNVHFRKVCITCRSGFLKWVLNHTNINQPIAVHKALSNINFALEPLPKSDTRKWPGFYAGNCKWVIPTNFLFTEKELNWSNSGDILVHLLETRGIFIKKTIQITNPS